jgi:lipoate-protein ligase B
MAAELWVAQLGRIPYAAGVDLQARIRGRRQAGEIPDALLLLEHPPVYTKGRRTTAADLPMGEDWYRLQGIEVAETDRGGRVTYHGPGQLVGYPIVAINDVPAYVRTMEAEVRPGETGVWASEAKIGSIGIHVSRGVTTHGFAINVDNDLQPFEWIVPCGLEGVRMTSLLKETGRTGRMGCFRKRVAYRLARELGLRQRLVRLERLAGVREPAPA